MASNINPTDIDITYPIAGQDNDTQGFRNNFTNIQSNFNIAASEITALQAITNSIPTITSVPTSLVAAGSAGQIAIDSNYLYVCAGPNDWLKLPNFTGNVTLNQIIGNTVITANGVYSTGKFVGSYSDGIVMDYVYPYGRITVGTGDSVRFYNGGTTSENLMATISSSTGLSVVGNINSTGTLNAQSGIISGNLSVGNISVTGTVTTINSTSSNIGTLTLTLAGNAASAFYANGAGIIVPVAGANILYVNSTNSWNFSLPIVVAGNITSTGNITSAGYFYSNGVSILSNVNALSSQYVTGLTSANVVAALGYTPYNNTNPSSYITSSALAGYATTSSVTSTLAGYITSGQLVSNLANYVQTVTLSNYISASQLIANLSNYVTTTTATNYVTSSSLSTTLMGYLTTGSLSGYATQSYVTGQGYLTSVPNSSTQVSSLGVGTAASGTTGEIRATNNITAYYSSDQTFKENIRPIPDALSTVTSIGGKLFDWTDDYINAHGGEDGYFIQKSDFGVVAQDVQKVFPQAVRTRPDGTLAVDYEKLSALAFAALCEVSTRLDKLEGK
jgi:Chaperone of endosialidase